MRPDPFPGMLDEVATVAQSRGASKWHSSAYKLISCLSVLLKNGVIGMCHWQDSMHLHHLTAMI